MTVINHPDRLSLITEFRNTIQLILSDQIRVKMQLESFSEDHIGGSSLSIFLTSEASSGEKRKILTEKALLSSTERRTLLGKPRDIQRFFDKEGSSYDEEFMLDIEFDYDAGTCTIHHINLPLHMRGRGFGGRIAQKTELLAKKTGMTDVYVPAEHRAAAFWLKRGYHFTFPAEKIFYESHSGRSNIYIAYDLRKIVSQGTVL